MPHNRLDESAYTPEALAALQGCGCEICVGGLWCCTCPTCAGHRNRILLTAPNVVDAEYGESITPIATIDEALGVVALWVERASNPALPTQKRERIRMALEYLGAWSA